MSGCTLTSTNNIIKLKWITTPQVTVQSDTTAVLIRTVCDFGSKSDSHFSNDEFTCHCCGQGTVDPKPVELLERLRVKANAPVHVNCDYRCPKHNAEIGGVPNSQHVLDTAADICIPAIGFEKARLDVRDGGIGSHIEWWD